MGRKAGLSDEKLRAVLGDDLTLFNDTERLVIELADALTDTPSNVSDELYARLRNQFSEEQLMQLGAQIAFENYRACWNRLFNVESDNFHQGNSIINRANGLRGTPSPVSIGADEARPPSVCRTRTRLVRILGRETQFRFDIFDKLLRCPPQLGR